MRGYDHTKIEKKWQAFWEKNKIYTAPDKAPGKDNFYLLVEFPYPSGNLHVGHWYAFAVPDILARYQRMHGKNVMYPIGFDAFGLPAENAAIKNKLNPRKWTEGNIAYMKKQIRSMGTSFDWSREVSTCDPDYYKWTQWLFLQLFKKGLAYQKETAVNWCPKDKTVLANEQVVNGRCERCESEVVQKMMLQWNIKITDYADRLIDDLASLDWPEQIKESQRNWIGRSEGAEIDFGLDLGRKYKFVILHGLHGFSSEGNRNRLAWMKEELEKLGHEVLTPALPNPDEPAEDEQVSVALKATTYDENTVLCGFSLGSVVALKVLEKLEKPIARLVMAGGFIDTKFKDGKLRGYEKNWQWKFDAAKIKRNVDSITILHDLQDHAISDDQVNRLSKLLEVPITLATTNKSHFKGDKEPDVLMWLRPTIRVFTTRADTLFGATYLVLAPEHPWLNKGLQNDGDTISIIRNRSEVLRYVKQASKKTELERQQETKDKTGVELKGVKAINPATGEKIPLYVADYVLGHYGTGAIMAVPAHDERDYQFATKFKLPIRRVIEPVFRAKLPETKIKEGQEIIKREAICAVIRNPKDDTYLCNVWKGIEMRGLLTGGVAEGEDKLKTALREIREETGYKNVRLASDPNLTINVFFYHRQKKENRWAHFHYLFFDLINESRDPINPSELAKHEFVWKKKSELKNFFTVFEGEFIANILDKPDYAYTGDGTLINSGDYNDMSIEEGKGVITEAFGRKKTTYKLRDWIVSRQRYWGVPIPILHCPKCGAQPVPDKNLPVELPEVKDYLPDGRGKSPLAKAKKWVTAKCPKCKGKAERETDTLDTFVDSSWYFLRYTDPNNKKKFADAKKMAGWMPVDLYSGGAEHTTMHLLYSRFWHKALFDLGLVKDSEPYKRRMNRSLILGPDGQKMSKSRDNVVDPDEVVERLGADTVRMYLAFIGPYNEVSSYPWNPDGVVGVRRFLERVWRAQGLVQSIDAAALNNILHKTIKKVGEDIFAQKFNTAISQMMIFLNAVEVAKNIGEGQWREFLKLLAPFAPHVAEELWRSKKKSSVHKETWPAYDERFLKDETIMIAVQINGKTRGEVNVASDADKAAIEKASRDAVASRLEGKKIVRTIVVPGRLVNFVVEN